MKIIDFHAHIYPDKIASRAVKSIGEFYSYEMDSDGTADTLLRIGRESGVSEFLVHSVAVTEKSVVSINNFIIDEKNRHSEFHGFMAMHADFEDKIGEAERAVRNGLKGLKIHPDTQKFNLDDERMFELYDYLQQNKLPLLIHTGDYRYPYSHPERLKRILREFPGLTAVGAHFGGWSVFDLAYEILENESCYVDTSSSLNMLGLRRGKELIRMYGADRVLFGSDFPMWIAKNEIEMLYKMELTDEEYEKIFHKNAEKLLGIEA